MSNPKFLKIFNQSTDSIAYSRMNNPVSVRLSGTTLVVTDNIIISNNAKLSFTAPCDCTEVTHMSIGGISYNLVDALGNTTNDTFKGFSANSKVSVLIDTQNRRAYVMNGAYGYKAPYEFAKESGYKGTVGEFYKLLATLDVDKTYETVKLAGYTGTKEEFYEALSTVDEPKGLKPTIIVTIGDDIDVSEVTMNWTENGVGKSKTLAVQDKKAIFEVFEYKTYTVSIVVNGKTESAPVTVDSVKQYRVQFPYFYATLAIKSPIGATITCTQNEELITKISTGEDNFTITSTGPWSVTVKRGTKSENQSVDIDERVGAKYTLLFLDSAYVTYGVRIDTTNDNPLTSVSYIEGTDAFGMTKGSDDWDSMPIFNAIRPCILKDGKVVKYLDPNNFTKDLSGNPVLISEELDGDVMIEFSKGGYSFIRAGQYIDIYITNNPSNEGYVYHSFSHTSEGDCEHFWLGAFLGLKTSSSIRSVSNVIPTTTLNSIITAMRTSEGYNIITYFQRLWVQILYLIKYGNLNSQEALGLGYTNTQSGVSNVTGSTVLSGMCSGSTSSYEHVKLFGVEDFWGNYSSCISCCKISTTGSSPSYNTRAHIYYPGGAEFQANLGEKSILDYKGYMSGIVGSNIVGFLCSTSDIKGSSTTYLTDKLDHIATNSGFSSGSKYDIVSGGGTYAGVAGGIFYTAFPLFGNFLPKYPIAARLSYCFPGK